MVQRENIDWFVCLGSLEDLVRLCSLVVDLWPRLASES